MGRTSSVGSKYGQAAGATEVASVKLSISFAPHCVDTGVFLSANMTREGQHVRAEQRLTSRPRKVISSSSPLASSFGEGRILI